MPGIIMGQRYGPATLFAGVRAAIGAALPGFKPYMALFGCSDEVNTSVDAERVHAFGTNNGIFTTRMIGSQVFFHQIMVAASTGHHSNVFEVNVHIGVDESAEGPGEYGSIVGRDGKRRDCCGALAHVLKDLSAANSNHLALNGLFLRSIRNNDPTFRFVFSFHSFDNDSIVQWSHLHVAPLLP